MPLMLGASSRKDVQAAIAEEPPLIGNLAKTGTRLGVWLPA